MDKLTSASIGIFFGSLVALVLSIVSITEPYWKYGKVGVAESDMYYGLWKVCRSYQLAETCHQLRYVTDSMVLVRTLEIIGALLLIVALLCRAVVHYGKRHSRQTVFIWDGLLTVVSGLVSLTGAVAFEYDAQDEVERFTDFYEYNLHSSFFMCIAGGIIAMVAGILRGLLERNQQTLRHGRWTHNQASLVPAVFGNSDVPQIVLVPMAQQPINVDQGTTGITALPALYPNVPMSQFQQLYHGGTGLARSTTAEPVPRPHGSDHSQTSGSSLPQPCPGSPTSTTIPGSDDGNIVENETALSTEPSPGPHNRDIEEPSSSRSMPLCNQRMVSDPSSMEEIRKPLSLTNN